MQEGGSRMRKRSGKIGDEVRLWCLLGLPDLANEHARCTIKLKFQRNSKKNFSSNMIHAIPGTCWFLKIIYCLSKIQIYLDMLYLFYLATLQPHPADREPWGWERPTSLSWVGQGCWDVTAALRLVSRHRGSWGQGGSLSKVVLFSHKQFLENDWQLENVSQLQSQQLGVVGGCPSVLEGVV